MVSTATYSYSLYFFEKEELQLKKNKLISFFFNSTKSHKNVTKSQQKIKNLAQLIHFRAGNHRAQTCHQVSE